MKILKINLANFGKKHGYLGKTWQNLTTHGYFS